MNLQILKAITTAIILFTAGESVVASSQKRSNEFIEIIEIKDAPAHTKKSKQKLKAAVSAFSNSVIQQSTKHAQLSEDDFFDQIDVDAIVSEHLSKSSSTKKDNNSLTQDNNPTLLNNASFDDEFIDEAAIALLDEAVANYNAQKNSEISTERDEVFPDYPYKHLTSLDDHEAYLLKTIHNAQRSIMITSWNFSATPSNHPDLFNALATASSKGVRIYLYFNKGEPVNFPFTRTEIKQHNVNIHSKLLVADDILALGSFDWLQDPTKYYAADSKNESIVLERGNLKPMVEQVWNSITSYRALSFNQEKIYGFEKRFKRTPPQIHKLIDGSKIELITTPQRHRETFFDAFQRARYRLIICAFSVTAYAQSLEDFLPFELLESYLNSGRLLQILYNPDKTKVQYLERHLNGFSDYSNLLLTPIKDLHQKTLIADHNLYMTGSYNLLSSANTLLDGYTYMETSVVIKGRAAKLLSDEFEANFPGIEN